MNTRRFFLFLLMLPLGLFAQSDAVTFEQASTFFPDNDFVNKENIKWGYLNVPVDWDEPQGEKIKLAVAIVPGRAGADASNPVIYLEGGPGGGGISKVGFWFNHPLREKHDIVVLDFRGTGFSEPRLCPDLGGELFSILAKNQAVEDDEQQKVNAALACKQDMLSRGLDPLDFTSSATIRDIHALKEVLQYEAWNVYAVSYGTQLAQIYANAFSDDIRSMVLDSAIPDIGQYYTKNTSNYVASLEKVFNACKNNPACQEQFPNLEDVYYETIQKLEANPVTVKVDESLVESGVFTYNAEDFKIAIHQALYHEKLLEVLPMLIYQFNQGNKSTLKALVQAFSGALGLDYGAYYCITCHDAIPFNAKSAYQNDVAKNTRLKQGLSFYVSDFKVCEAWNETTPIDSTDLAVAAFDFSASDFPVLVLAGQYDPITPEGNGLLSKQKFKNGIVVSAPANGHGPSFTMPGIHLVSAFMRNPQQEPTAQFPEKEVNFATDVILNPGVSNMANSLIGFDLLFLFPIGLALLILIAFFVVYIVSLLRKKYVKEDKYLRILIVLTSLAGMLSLIGIILAILNTASQNYFILAFGLPVSFGYLFFIQRLFLGLLLITSAYAVVKFRYISNLDVVATVWFSLVLVGVYFFFWSF